jgi:hypothetical protein
MYTIYIILIKTFLVILNTVALIYFFYLSYKGAKDIVLFILYRLLSDGRKSFREIVDEMGVGTPSQCYRDILKSNFMRWSFILTIFMTTLYSVALVI